MGCTDLNFDDCCTHELAHPREEIPNPLNVTKDILYHIHGATFPLFSCLSNNLQTSSFKTYTGGLAGIDCDLHFKLNDQLMLCPFKFLYDATKGVCSKNYNDCCEDSVTDYLANVMSMGDNIPQLIVKTLSNRLICPSLNVLPQSHSFTAPFPHPNYENFAVELKTQGSSTFFSCLKALNYQGVFLDAYTAHDDGKISSSVIMNKHYADQNGLQVYFLVSLSMTGKTGKRQFNEINAALQGMQLDKRMYLKVVNPNLWTRDGDENVEIIRSFVYEAALNDISVGIYTNWYDWPQITASATKFSHLPLLYNNIRGEGPRSETSQNFHDFFGFGGWNFPTVKQFGYNVEVCGRAVNRLVYY